MWIDPNTKDVAITHSDIRVLRPNWSGPAVMTDEMVEDLGFTPVILTTPEYDPKTQKVAELAPKLVDNVWTQQWEITQLTDEEVAAIYKASVPSSVTRRQARQALLLRGLLDKVQPALDAIPDPLQRGMAQIEWMDSLNFERHRPMLIQIGHALGLDEAGLDDLFIQAAKL